MQNPGHSSIILCSCKGYTQCDPMAMVLYSIVLVPLVKNLKNAFLEVMQLWCVDDLALIGKKVANAKCFKVLNTLGCGSDTFLNPKSHGSYVALRINMMQEFAKEGLTIHFSWGTSYIGRFVRADLAMQEWLATMI